MMEPSLSCGGEDQQWVQTTAKPQILRGEDGPRRTLVVTPVGNHERGCWAEVLGPTDQALEGARTFNPLPEMG